jgi:hypothetical protein
LGADPFVSQRQPSGQRRNQRVLLEVAQLCVAKLTFHPWCFSPT